MKINMEPKKSPSWKWKSSSKPPWLWVQNVSFQGSITQHQCQPGRLDGDFALRVRGSGPDLQDRSMRIQHGTPHSNSMQKNISSSTGKSKQNSPRPDQFDKVLLVEFISRVSYSLQSPSCWPVISFQNGFTGFTPSTSSPRNVGLCRCLTIQHRCTGEAEFDDKAIEPVPWLVNLPPQRTLQK